MVEVDRAMDKVEEILFILSQLLPSSRRTENSITTLCFHPWKFDINGSLTGVAAGVENENDKLENISFVNGGGGLQWDRS